MIYPWLFLPQSIKLQLSIVAVFSPEIKIAWASFMIEIHSSNLQYDIKILVVSEIQRNDPFV